ncbi:MAG: ATP-binding protein, partial [Nanoarchaeota archaeon]|nr:ATP-binding protein [Nanoarchaeota archaeon]
MAREITAFANSSGGKIFLGISDDNKIKGVRITNKLKSQIQDIARNCDPPVKIGFDSIEIEKKPVLVVIIPEGENKPYQCSLGFYLRQGSNSQKLTRDEIIDFSIGEGKIKFDKQINTKFDFKKDFNEKKLNEYLNLAGIEKDLDVNDILTNLGVAISEKNRLIFNNACILFFAKNPGKFFPTSKVICVNYQTNEKLKILDRKIFDDGIIENIKEAIAYIKKHVNVEFVIKKLKREEIPQYPEEAIRECIVNAVMHRDYFDDSGDILIEVFRNKIIISNPGGLVKGLKPEEFGKVSRTRNSLIAGLLSRTEYVEKLGTGINRIRKALKESNLPHPRFEYNHSFFVTLYDKTGISSELVEGLVEGLVETQKKILDLVSDSPRISKR